MDNANVAHKWANQIGAKAAAGRFYFDGCIQARDMKSPSHYYDTPVVMLIGRKLK